MTLKEVFVVGSGMMGSGIAQVFAQAGIPVTINDTNRDALQKAQQNIAWSVGKFFEKGRLSEDLAIIMERLQYSDELGTAATADLVIEAVFENLDVKQSIFRQLDEICKPEAVLASNTSSLPITELATATQRPENVLGLHFFSPVPMMRAVEVVRGMSTSEETMQAGIAAIKTIGKEPVRVESDMPGFLLNRINMVSYVEAINLLERKIATVEDIDKGVRLAFGRPMGPFETGDMVGLDVSCNALQSIYEESRDARYYPPQLLRRKVRSGHLGRKRGRGWYIYDDNGQKTGVA